MTPSLDSYIMLSAALFAVGFLGVLVRRNTLVIYMCLELMLVAATLALVAACGLALRAAVRAVRRSHDTATTTATGTTAARRGAPDAAVGSGPRHRRRPPPWERPWYQSRTAILVAATVPPISMRLWVPLI